MVCLSHRGGLHYIQEREALFGGAHAAAHRVRFEAKGCLAKRATEGRGPLAKLRKNERHGRGAWAGWVGGDIKRRERRVVSTLLDGA